MERKQETVKVSKGYTVKIDNGPLIQVFQLLFLFRDSFCRVQVKEDWL